MKEIEEISAAYQVLVNKTLDAIKKALETKDFALLDELRVVGTVLLHDNAEELTFCSILSEEQALHLHEKWEAIEKILDEKEELFTTRQDNLRDFPDVPETVDEGWGG